MSRYLPMLLLIAGALAAHPLPAVESTPSPVSLPAAVRISAAEEARASTVLTATHRIELNAIASLWRRDPASTQADLQWHALMANINPPLSPNDQRLVLRWTLRNAYLETEREMQFHSARAEDFEEAQQSFITEARRARIWIAAHRAAGTEAVDPPFLPDTKLDRPDPIRGPKPRITDRALTTLQAVDRYAMGIERQYSRMGEDAQLAHLAAQRAGGRQRHLLDQAAAIIARLISGDR